MSGNIDYTLKIDGLSEEQLKELEHEAQVIQDLALCWEPHEGQELVKIAIFANGKKTIFIECGRKWGKALALNTPILTPSGFKPIGEIVDGDIVYDENGKEVTVLKAHDVIEEAESYRVWFCNGAFIDACKDHQWLTWTKSDRRNFRRGYEVKPTVKNTLDLFNSQMCGKEFNHSIPYTKPVELSKKELLIEPYLFGCWLGDGSSYGAKITSVDSEILETFSGYGLTKYDETTYGIGGKFVTKLKELGVIPKKFIPEQYLMGSIEQRLELLQGLMDTDGYINESGSQAYFYNTNEDIAKGVEFLVSSLGMKPKIRIKEATLNGVRKKDCFVVSFKPLVNVFKLTRKAKRISVSKKTEHHTIVKVEKIPNKPMRCLSVSGESMLFLAGENLIPTHNTEFLCYVLYRFAMSFPRSACYYIAPFQKQAREIVWANGRLQNFFQPLIDPKTKLTHRGHTYAQSLQIRDELMDKYGLRINDQEMRLWFGNGSFIKLDGADNHQAYRGISPSIIVYDEFKDHHPKFHTGMDPNLAAHDAPLIIVGTPPEGDENNAEQFISLADFAAKDPNQAYFNAPTKTNPHISRKFLERKKAELFARGEDDKWYREYEAKRVRAGAKLIFPMFEDLKVDDDTLQVSYSKHVKSREEISRALRYRKEYDFFCIFDPATSSTFAVLLGAIHKRNKKIILIDEIYETKKIEMSAGKIFPRALKMIDKYNLMHDDVRFIYDNAASWFANEVSVQFGYGLEPCIKDIKEKESRISLIKDLYNFEFIVVSEDCVKFRWETNEYRTDDNNKFIKENDHLIDCLRYLLANAYYNRVEYHLIEEEVAERRGYKLGEESFRPSEPLNPFNDILEEYYT